MARRMHVPVAATSILCVTVLPLLATPARATRCEPLLRHRAGAAVLSLGYTPAKALLAGSGAILGLFASPDPSMSQAIFDNSFGGDWVVRGEHVGCGKEVNFMGGADQDESAPAEETAPVDEATHERDVASTLD